MTEGRAWMRRIRTGEGAPAPGVRVRAAAASAVAACSSVSTMRRRAPESRRIQATCSAEEVAYTGTVRPPAARTAKSTQRLVIARALSAHPVR